MLNDKYYIKPQEAYRKLGVKSKLEAINKARKRNII